MFPFTVAATSPARAVGIWGRVNQVLEAGLLTSKAGTAGATGAATGPVGEVSVAQAPAPRAAIIAVETRERRAPGIGRSSA
jgi:hypothetical protein